MRLKCMIEHSSHPHQRMIVHLRESNLEEKIKNSKPYHQLNSAFMTRKAKIIQITEGKIP